MYHLSAKIPSSHRKSTDGNNNDQSTIKSQQHNIKELSKIDTTSIITSTTMTTTTPSTPTKIVDLPARRISISEASTQTNKDFVTPEEIGCLLALKTLILKSKRLMEIFTYFRL